MATIVLMMLLLLMMINYCEFVFNLSTLSVNLQYLDLEMNKNLSRNLLQLPTLGSKAKYTELKLQPVKLDFCPELLHTSDTFIFNRIQGQYKRKV